jgi:hypothetical protein
VILAYHIFAQVCLVKYMSEYNDYLYNYRWDLSAERGLNCKY